jgi:hypothetical protein
MPSGPRPSPIHSKDRSFRVQKMLMYRRLAFSRGFTGLRGRQDIGFGFLLNRRGFINRHPFVFVGDQVLSGAVEPDFRKGRVSGVTVTI